MWVWGYFETLHCRLDSNSVTTLNLGILIVALYLMYENMLVLRKYIVKYWEVKEYNTPNLIPNSSEKNNVYEQIDS